MDFRLNVQGSPHVRDNASTRKIMLDVIIAMLPATIWGIMQFGLNAALVVVVSVVACILSETVFNMIVKRPNTVSDLSCVVTGLIIALNMPPEIPLFVPVVGSIFAIFIAKMLFGGLGQNFMNPALAGRCFCLISFTGLMTNFSSKLMNEFTANLGIDATSSATPLYVIQKNLGTPHAMDLFMGYIPGTIGEISTICLLLGAAYLLVKKVISISIPLTYIVTFVIFLMIFSGRPTDVNYLLCEVCGGGLIFGAFFMATDYVTSPVTPLGRVLFGIFLGVLTGIFRLWGKAPESVSYVILLGNILVPLIESVTVPRAFGKEGK